MSFYPILKIPGFEGGVTVHNYSPNNFQSCKQIVRHVYVCWADGKCWTSHKVATLHPGESLTVQQHELIGLIPEDSLPFVFLSKDFLKKKSSSIKEIKTPSSSLPAWRSTISLEFGNISRTSYQGEIDPLPTSGTCLTFNYLVQPQDGVETWLIALNLIDQPSLNPAVLNFFDPKQPGEPLHQETLRTNGINSFLIPHDIAVNENIAIACQGASFIPIFFSHNKSRTQLSLEHTHPPGSCAIFGDRLQVQRAIKKNWLSKLYVSGL